MIGLVLVPWYSIGEIFNSKIHHGRIRWAGECLGKGDERVTDQKLAMGNWNMKTMKKGGWREDI